MSKYEKKELLIFFIMRDKQAPNHAVSTAALCACSFTNAYLMISVFPYAGYMVMDLMEDRVTQDNVGTYAGLIASSFMAGKTLSAYAWGKASDVYGRTFVLKANLLLSSAFSLFFGMATSLRAALFLRFCLGLSSSGLISVVKSSATELADGDQAAERRTMGIVIGMRSWGYLLVRFIVTVNDVLLKVVSQLFCFTEPSNRRLSCRSNAAVPPSHGLVAPWKYRSRAHQASFSIAKHGGMYRMFFRLYYCRILCTRNFARK